MAGNSLTAALVVNFSIGVIKTIVGLFTGSAAMIAEAYHSFADTFNQILLVIGIRRSKQEPDHDHPFGYKKVQFFWAFVVAVLIFGISGTLALLEGLEIIRDPEHHKINTGIAIFGWQLAVLAIAIVLESFALMTAVKETRVHQKAMDIPKFTDAVDEMQDPVLLSLLVEDTLALVGLVIAFIGSVITFVTEDPIVDGITSLIIGIVLMIGGLLLARENKTYLVGKSVNSRVQKQIRDIIEKNPSVEKINLMKTMLLGPEDLILALDITFTQESKTKGATGSADDIDQIEKELGEALPYLTPDKIFIESQIAEVE